MKRLLFCFSILVYILTACKKEESKTLNIPLIKKIQSKLGDTVSFVSYIYDSQDRLVEILDSNNNLHAGRTKLIYDQQGKLTGATDSIFFAGVFTNTYIYSFQHDNNGRIIQRYSGYSVNPNASRNTYAYDLNGRLISDTVYNNYTGAVYSYFNYIYNQDGNLGTKNIYLKQGSGFQLHETQQMQYDQRPNPFYDLRDVLHFLTAYDQDQCLSVNNYTSKTALQGSQTSYSYQYNYQYNSDGSPHNYTMAISGQNVPIQVNYFY